VAPHQRPRPRSEILADELRKQILAGNYRPGDRLPPERQLAQQLGVGRSTVREAFKKLEQLRLVEIRHGGGATVGQLESASLDVVPMLVRHDGVVNVAIVEQLLEARRVLIVAATRLAVERATAEDLRAARRVLWRLDDGGISDLDYFRALDELIDRMCAATQNLVLHMARNALQSIFNPSRRARIRPRLRPPSDLVGPMARRLERAIVDRDPDAAAEGMTSILRVQEFRILEYVRSGAAEQPMPEPDEAVDARTH
jgi:GntR family transcriptional repressor for pyruvate dehydrogenase complex